MAHAADLSGIPAFALGMWDIRTRIDRVLMDSPISNYVVEQRTKRQLSRPLCAAIVTSPHRLTPSIADLLRNQDYPVIALLGDNPVGERCIAEDVVSAFDRIYTADESWTPNVSCRDVRVMTWGSTITGRDLLNAAGYVPESVAIVGAPYDDRVEAAKSVVAAGYNLLLWGDAWRREYIQGAEVHPSTERLETIRQLRQARSLVLNVHHRQFSTGMNPQFFDYAASAVPQLILKHGNAGSSELGKAIEVNLASIEHLDRLLRNAASSGTWADLTARVRAQFMFGGTLREMLQ
jgi:hypothetical protein